MKTDISRKKTFREEKHYDRVTMQQGRVQLDADWNEQADIRIYRSRITSRDVIGKNGAPTENPGFEIRASRNFGGRITTPSGHYTIGKGRYYVDGILCENENDIDAGNQPDFPLLLLCSWDDISFDDSHVRNHAIRRILHFLRAFIPSFKDTNWSDLNAARVEVRKNGKEKIVRTSEFPNDFISITIDNENPGKATRAIVRFDEDHKEVLELVIVKDTNEEDKIKLGYSPAIPFTNGQYIVYLDVWEREITCLDDRHLLEVALGGIDTATRTKIVWQVKLLPVSANLCGDENRNRYNKEIEQGLQQRQDYKVENGVGEKIDESYKNNTNNNSHLKPRNCYCDSKFPEWEDLISEPIGTLQARLKPPQPARDNCELPSNVAYRGTTNQLYRVEIHDGGGLNNGATFKWSRDNGIVTSKIVEISGNKVTVENIGRDNSRFGYPLGSWIEFTDDLHELWNIPGTLAKVMDVKGTEIYFDLDSIKGDSISYDNYPKMYNPKVRRWDSIGNVDQGVSTQNEGYIDLENDIQIKFGKSDRSDSKVFPAIFTTGGYWLIEARTTDELKIIEWPIDEAGKPAALQPEGIKHHYTKLALLSVTDLKEKNEEEYGRELEEKQKSIGRQQRRQQQEEKQHQQYDREGITSGSQQYNSRIDDCRRFYLPLNSLSLHYVSGDGQEGLKNSILSTELKAQVTSGDIPVKGVMVKFTVEKGHGRLLTVEDSKKDREYWNKESCIVSNDAGYVACRWRLADDPNQQVKAIIVDTECLNVLVNLPVYFNANLSEVNYSIPKSGEEILDLKDGRPKDGIYKNYKHHAGIPPGKYGVSSTPPYIGLGFVSLIVDETTNNGEKSDTNDIGLADATVQFIYEGFPRELPTRRVRLRAVNIGPETFDISLEEREIEVLNKKAKALKVRWWAIACQEVDHQLV